MMHEPIPRPLYDHAVATAIDELRKKRMYEDLRTLYGAVAQGRPIPVFSKEFLTQAGLPVENFSDAARHTILKMVKVTENGDFRSTSVRPYPFPSV